MAGDMVQVAATAVAYCLPSVQQAIHHYHSYFMQTPNVLHRPRTKLSPIKLDFVQHPAWHGLGGDR